MFARRKLMRLETEKLKTDNRAACMIGQNPYLAVARPSRLFCQIVAILFCLLGLGYQNIAYADGQAADTFSGIKPTLAFVVSKSEKKTIAFGTAFCIYSSDDISIFLTNRHVVGKDRAPRLVLMAHPDKVYTGTVVRSGTSLDIAVVAVALGNVPVATLAAKQPVEGQSIGIAGFPAFQINLFLHKLGLSPSLHLGTVSALIGKGVLLEYDAQTDHGNSGGPVFDVQSGVVYGVVTRGNTGDTGAVQNNVAIAVQDLTPFFVNAHVAPNIASSSSPAPSSNSNQPSSSSGDLSACHTAVTEIQSAYSDWSSAYSRYIGATNNTTAAVPTYVPRGPYASMSYVGVEVYVNLEVKAIKSVIDAEEPKLQNAQSDVEASGNIQLSRITAQLINDIGTADQYSQLWTQSRSRLIYTAAAGNFPPPVDQSAAERVRNAMTEISTIETQLRIGDPCS